uniref:DUF3147 family protein n=1 Tax=Marseillevirus LCMAC101 TaxID=2506602 RepID=A0A481YQH2_9VIRU|nr:MAG: hypothetical protein LCMAC101_00800 [Marseillevirus LCMAC101]
MGNNNWSKYLRGAFIAGLSIGIALYLADHTHPALAGLFAAIPIALPTILLLEDDQIKDYSFTLGLGIASYVLAIFLFYYLHVKQKWPAWKAMAVAMLVWITVVCLAYHLFSDGPFTANG